MPKRPPRFGLALILIAPLPSYAAEPSLARFAKGCAFAFVQYPFQ
jgi:hypothetical protein